jgi:anti-anti-sigma factor
MLIEIQQQNELCILRFQGRFASGAQLDYLKSKLAELQSLTASKMLLDFREVTSIGSTGLGFVVRMFEAIANRHSGRFVVTGLNPRVREAFEVTGLSAIIPMAADIESGMRALLDEATPLRALSAPSSQRLRSK